MSILLKSPLESIVLSTTSTSEVSYSLEYNILYKGNTASNSIEGLINTITETTILPYPSPNYKYELTNAYIVNNGGVGNVIGVNKLVNAVSYPLLATDITLGAGEYLQYNVSEGWRRYNATGEFMTVGATGADGLSAYQVALANGFVGTEAAWLASLVGPSGVVQSVVAGTNVTVDNTDPANPIVSSSGGGTATWGGITGTLSTQADLQTALDGKVDENSAITGATKTKITYDAKGLVTSGADATTADIADSTDKRYVTDANLAVINNTSNVNTGDQNLTPYFNKSVDDTDDITEGAKKFVTATDITKLSNTSGVNTGDQNLTPYFNKSVDDTDDINEGATNLFWSNPRTIASVLTGLSVTGSTIASTDTILQAFGKAQSQINSLVGGVNYQGSWNASTNTPALVSSVGTKGYYYVVSVAGATNLDGIIDWKLGDWAIFNGSIWQKIDNTDAVISVNGYSGIVVLTTGDVADSTNKRYITDAQLVVLGNTSGTNTGDQTTTAGLANTTNKNLVTDAQLGVLANTSGINTGDQTNISGNAATATILQTARTINGVAFDGSAPITVTANANTLTGLTLNATVVNSSLTSVGLLTNLSVTNPVTGSITGNAATVTTNANLTGPVTSVGNATSIANGAISNAMLANPAVSDLTGSNSGDNAVNTRYEGIVSGPTYSTGTSILNFGNEQDHIVNTIAYATVTAANFRGITFLPTETSETSLDDFTLNGVTFAIENIVDGVSFDIRGSAVNEASGNYTIKYQIATN